MQMTRNGIPIDVPGQRKKAPTTSKFKAHRDFNKYKRFATMVGYEDGCNVTATIPMGHPEFNKLLAQGYKVIDIWQRGE